MKNEIFHNAEIGLETEVYKDTGKVWTVIFRDTDAEKVIAIIRFSKGTSEQNHSRAVKRARCLIRD